jgi:hypothetical protein
MHIKLAGPWESLQSIGLPMLEDGISLYCIHYPQRGEGLLIFSSEVVPGGEDHEGFTQRIRMRARRRDPLIQVVLVHGNLPAIARPFRPSDITLDFPETSLPFTRLVPISASVSLLYRLHDTKEAVLANYFHAVRHPHTRVPFANGVAIYTLLNDQAQRRFLRHGFPIHFVRGLPYGYQAHQETNKSE